MIGSPMVPLESAAAESEVARLRRELQGEIEAHKKTRSALVQKDQAMSVLFDRLAAAGVDCSDLIP